GAKAFGSEHASEGSPHLLHQILDLYDTVHTVDQGGQLRLLGKATWGRAMRPPRARRSDDLADPNNSNSTELKASFSPSSGKVVAIKVHYLVPGSREVLHECLLRVDT